MAAGCGWGGGRAPGLRWRRGAAGSIRWASVRAWRAAGGSCIPCLVAARRKKSPKRWFRYAGCPPQSRRGRGGEESGGTAGPAATPVGLGPWPPKGGSRGRACARCREYRRALPRWARPRGAVCSSAPRRLGRRAVCVAAAAPAFLLGGEESKGAGVSGGLSVPSVTPAGVARRLVRVRCAYAAARLSRRAGAVAGAEAAGLGQRRCCPVTPAATATCQSMRSPSSSCKYYPLALNMHLKQFLGQLGKCPKMRVSWWSWSTNFNGYESLINFK